MNHIYRSIWSKKTGAFVAVSENTKNGGKSASGGGVVGSGFALKTLAVSLSMAFGSHVYALPVNGIVTAGNATITSGAGNTTVNQGSQNVALNWQSFNIGKGEAVTFVQPNSSSVALNRVLGADPSSILGNLSANGKVFLINPNGILFGQGASVNVGGLVASTLNLSDSDFMAGRYKFADAGAGAILNQGSISADGGYVALLGANVSNQGTINARLGTVALAAGNAITLDVAGDGFINVTVDRGALKALVDNGGMIQADGGHVLLSAQAAGQLLHTVVNNTGIIQAQTIGEHNGTIRLLGDMQSGSVNVGGQLDASAPAGGNGGFIDTSAAQVKIADGARVTTAAQHGLTGTWLIDPVDFTIAPGSAAQTGSGIGATTLSSNLASGNVSIVTGGTTTGNGDIFVNSAVSWDANKLTLSAHRDININANLNASGTASLALEFGQGAVAAGNTSNVITNGGAVNLPAGTTNFTTKQGSDGSTLNYTVITSLGAQGSTSTTDLQGMNANTALNYALGGNIDATASAGWNGGTGFTPVSDGNSTFFTGTFDGLGHTISNLTINRPGVDKIGLFGDIRGAVRNIGLVGGSVTGANYVGALAGRNYGDVNNSYSTGSVQGANYVGGIAGFHQGTMTNSHATGSVTGSYKVGGLLGWSYGSVDQSYATGNVTGTGNRVGGLVGDGQSTIDRSYATGTVSGAAVVGGLVGGGGVNITNSYSTAQVAGSDYVGGLVGAHEGGTISNSYATGAVTGTGNNVGGLVGYGRYGSVSNSYASGAVTGNGGGLVGAADSFTVSNSFWNTDTSGRATSGGGTGLTSLQMQTASNFTGFNFTTTPGAAGNNWVMVDVDGSLNNAGGALGGTRPMLASEYSTTINNAHQLQLMSMNLAGKYTVGQHIDAAATGTASDVWSGSSFIPVGNNNTLFTGTFNGLGHTIGNLTINLPSTSYVGLFGANGGLIQNVGLIAGSVIGSSYAGGLVGNNANSNALITNSYNTGSVSGSSYLGGLVGQNWSGAVANSYATGNITGTGNNIGGLVGYGHNSATVNNSYATGNVIGGAAVGGLMGSMNKNSAINNSYATGSVTASMQYSGGLIGSISSGAGVSNSYSTGAVTGGSQVGGLIGATGSGTGASNSFWDTQTSGQATSAGGAGATGLTTAQMKTASVFSSLDFANTWVIYDTYTNPLLRSFMTALTVTANNDSKTYDGLAYSGGNGVTYSSTPNMSNVLGTASYSGTSQGTINAGTYDITASGRYSNQQGYLISYVAGGLTVNKANLTLGSGNVSKTYDGGLTALGTAAITSGALISGDTISGGTFAFTDKNAGSNKTVTTTGVTVTDGNNGGNYNVSYANNTASTITQANLTLGSGNVSKTYDGGLSVAGTATVTSGTLFGSDALSGGTFAYTDKNAGSNKTVTTTGVTVTDGNSGNNYNVSYADNTASTIAAKALTATATALNKTYDGTTTAAAALTIASGLVGSETVTATGGATFNSKDVANANLVTVNSTALVDGANGGLASNYRLASGQTAAATIAAKALTISGMAAANKIYDGNTAATLNGGTLNGLIGAETLALTGQKGAFADKNVGTAKAVTVTGTALANGTGLAGNYSIANPTGLTADITRLTSVAWVGGASGNWFDAGNWAGGAVPDLANVANVAIPAGVSVTIDNGIVVMPAQAGTVNVESIGSGGRVSMVDGSLSVVNSVKLASIAQSGGTFKSGTIEVGTFTQSGGSLTSTGNLTVTNAYSQSGSGASVNVGGNVSISQTSGSAVLGNITTAGSLGITAVNGNIAQVAGTRMASTGAGTLSAPNGTVSLAGSGNSLGAVTISDSDSLAASSGGVNDARLQNALASALSMDGMNAPERTAGASSLAAGQSMRRLPSGSSPASILTGLNVTLVGQGVKLPPGVQPDGANDDEK
ncbi:MAG: YDG domain-containing protein [Undibacterium sp.]|uniref:two-partner secretion domain-containing protein n=1 Tax=Undibacterium sp. TaxID=1914977 RepID=UPI00272037C1|nr:YDG domain-containing protein [Undibacterium sp.]MDO8654113.1 YDG domain-containing protein [Undibacterium sp.]